MQLFSEKLRIWDRVAAERPDFYLANSEFVRQRIRKYYQRQAKVLYPGVELPEPLKLERQDYYLACGRITAQKYFDLVVEAFNELKLPLKIVGEGPLLQQMQELNRSDKTEFLGFVSDQELMELYAGAKALVFPQAEDFGIVPIEAQAQGCPVLFYAKGGALETCLANNEAGIGFAEQSVEALKQAVLQFEQRQKIDHRQIREHVDQFSSERFSEDLMAYLAKIS
jgi:glycosyltransferase involved in cell wall biosynthesis